MEQMTMLSLGNPKANQFFYSLPKGGIILTALATLFELIADLFSRKLLQTIKVGVFSVVSMFAAVAIFTFIVIAAFGVHHFDDLFSPFLWEWMIVYGAIIVVLSEMTWIKGLKNGATSSDISVANAVSPVAGIIFAFIIIQEIPNSAQIIGGIIIMLGIVISLYGDYRTEHPISIKKPRSFKGY